MKAAGVNLPALMQANEQYIIPLFQRFYSWGTDDWYQLWQDLTDLQESEEADWHHFMGTLVFVPQKHFPGVLSNLGRWGNGDVEVGVETLDELPYVLGLVRQSLERQLGGGSAG